MSGLGFENIFEKYNIICDVPTNRRKGRRSLRNISINKNTIWMRKTTNAGNDYNKCNPFDILSSSSIINNTMKRNTKLTTRRSTLMEHTFSGNSSSLAVVESVTGNENCGNSPSHKTTAERVEQYTETANVISYENSETTRKEWHSSSYFATAAERKFSVYENNSSGNLSKLDFNQTYPMNSYNGKIAGNIPFTCSFNLDKTKQVSKNYTKAKLSRFKPLDIITSSRRRNLLEFQPSSSILRFDKSNLNNASSNFLNSAAYNLDLTESFNLVVNSSIKTPTETPLKLDLFVDQIQRDDSEDKENFKKKHYKKHKTCKSNCDDNAIPMKPSLQGGYEEMFQRVLKREKVKSKFLKYDKKFGLRIGVQFRVIKLETTYGVTIARVKSAECTKSFGIVVLPEIAPQLKYNTPIEVFFDDKTIPYTLQINEEYLDVYLEPYKLLVE